MRGARRAGTLMVGGQHAIVDVQRAADETLDAELGQAFRARSLAHGAQAFALRQDLRQALRDGGRRPGIHHPAVNALAPDDGPDAQHWVVSEDPFYRYGVDAPRGVDWRAVPDGYSTLPLEGDCRPLNVFVTTLPPVGSRPEVRFIVALDSTPYMETLGAFTSTLVGMSVAGTLFVALLGYFIARLGLFPVRRLSAQAHGLAPGNSGQRLRTEHLPSEIKDMAVSFNGVLERQEVAWRQLESFNADVAHELRTPLTNLVGQTQLGLAVGKDVHEFKELLQSNLEELERMTSIINDMLFLSHAQVGRMAMDLSDVSLREEAAKTTEYVEPLFGDKTLTLTLRGDARALIDRRLFHRALGICRLIHVRPGCRLRVSRTYRFEIRCKNL
jgi:two-component system heavy metal sensor histidine kinase CusS